MTGRPYQMLSSLVPATGPFLIMTRWYTMLDSFRRRAVIGLKHVVLVILAIALAGLWSSVVAAEKDAYRPYEHPFPQVIQAKDYPTIVAIEETVPTVVC